MKFSASSVASIAFVLTMQFAQAAALPKEDRAEVVKQTIKAICASDKPALVVDTFALPAHTASGILRLNNPSMDIDGDGVPEISHGDLVGAVLASTGKVYQPYNIPEWISAEDMAGIFNGIAQAIADGRLEKPSFINLSSSISYEIDRLNRLVPALVLTPDNLDLYRQEILAGLIDNDKDGENYGLLRDALAQLEKMGVTTVIGAGNDFSPTMVNIFSFMPGTITGSALEHDGKTPAPYADENSAVDFHRNGEVFARAVTGGIDINGDEAPEFQTVSGGSKIVTAYVGKNPKGIVKKLPAELEGQKKFPSLARQMMQDYPLKDGLYRTQDIYELLYGYPLAPQYERDMNAYGPYVHYPSWLAFRQAANGTLRYDPASNGDRAVVADFRGTSYAPPRLCVAPK